ncbi:radical SAM protein [Synergistaceae bacterium OttesenSCG-928-D05]|nr:radical SAM protein [Synergistaceae bacterium OttesenSCG-928-D05]
MSKILGIRGKNILGVNPPVHDFAFFDLWSKPMGLLYLLERMRLNGNDVFLLDTIYEAAASEKTFGRKKIVGTEIEKPKIYKGIQRKYHHFGLGEDEIRARLSETPQPDVILLTSAMTYWYPGVQWMIAALKEILPGVPVVLGGTYATLCTGHAATLGADFIVSGNWEPDVARPAMDLYKNLSYGVTMTSFGCPLACEYCASRVLWPHYRRRSVHEVLREIDFQVQLGARDFAFYDDALLMEKEDYFFPLCEALRKRYGNALRFHTPNGLHVREIDEKCAAVLWETGFKTIRLSLESIDPKLAGSGKVVWREYADAVANLKSAGYAKKELETYILLGLPGQVIDSVKETISFVHASGGKPKLAEFSPIPHTPAFEEAAKAMPALRTEPLLQNNSVYSSWISQNITPQELQELKDLARAVF